MMINKRPPGKIAGASGMAISSIWPPVKPERNQVLIVSGASPGGNSYPFPLWNYNRHDPVYFVVNPETR